MKIRNRWVAAALTVSLFTAACSSGDDGEADGAGDETTDDGGGETTDDGGGETTDDGADGGDAGEIATGLGIDDETIRVGMLSDLDGPFAGLVIEISEAQQVFWDQVNAEGGIAGRQIELLEENTSYDVPTHLEKYDILRDEVATISLSTGSPHTAAIAPELVADELIASPLSWFSGWAEQSELGSNAAELYANYCIESMNGIEYHVENNGVQSLAIVSFPGEYGGDGAAGAAIVAAELGLDVVYDGTGQITPPSADNPNPDQSAVISQIVENDPDMVWLTANTATLGSIMGGAVSQGFDGIWSGNSPTYSYKLLGTELAPALDAYYYPSQYGVAWGADVPGMQPMIDAMTAARPELPTSDAYILGWTYADLHKQLLEQAAANGDMTRAGILEALGQLNATFDGLAPDQSFVGEPNDYIVRETYIYDVTLDTYNPVPLGEGGGGTGSTLLDGPYMGSVAENYTFEGACFGG